MDKNDGLGANGDAEPTPAPTIGTEFTSGTVDAGLRAMRARLLDLTGRNRLLNFRHSPKSTLRFVDAQMEGIFERLADGERIVIEEVPDPPPVPVSRPLFDGGQEPEPKPTASEFARALGWSTSYDLEDVSQREDRLRALHYPDALDSICRRIGSAARTAIEESGTNMLYLTFGFLEWFESEDSSEARMAPLVTVPVILHRAQDRNGRAALEWSGDDVAPNLSLIERMKRDFAIEVPTWDEEERLRGFFGRIGHAIHRKSRWRVRPQITLSLLSFGKLLMYRDLDPEVWPQIRRHAIVQELFEGRKSDVISHASEYTFDDEQAPPVTPPGVVLDADSSQLSALVDAMQGRNLVIEGPPGTGKSQTISNLIAAALDQGKTVLFVSEKLAALQVVRRRLDQAGLGYFCLELHSHKSRKDALVRDVEARIDAAARFPAPKGVEANSQKLNRIKASLRRYARLLQHHHEPLDCSLFELVWRRERLAQETSKHAALFEGLELSDVLSAGRHDLDRIELNLLVCRRHLDTLLARWATPGSHPWAWVRTPISYEGMLRIKAALADAKNLGAELREIVNGLVQSYGLEIAETAEQKSASLGWLDKLPDPPADCNYELLGECRDDGLRTALVSLIDQVGKWRKVRNAVQRQTTDDGHSLLRYGAGEAARTALAVLSTIGLEQRTLAEVDAYFEKLRNLQSALRLATTAYDRVAPVLGWEGPCRLNQAAAVVVCLESLAGVSPGDLYLRNALFETAGLTDLIAEAERQSAELVKQWATLSAEYDMALAASTGAPAVRSHAQSLASASFRERWFGRRYREAATFCGLLSLKSDRRKPKELARDLLDVAAAVEARDRFGSNPRYSSALQQLFRALDTDWKTLGRVAAWYETIRDRLFVLSPPEAEAVKTLLFRAPSEHIARLAKQTAAFTEDRGQLDALPEILGKLEAEHLATSGEATSDVDARIGARLKEGRESLAALRVLHLRDETTLDMIPHLFQSADEYRGVVGDLEGNERARAVIDTEDWEQINLQTIASTVEFAGQVVAGGWPERLQRAVLAPGCLAELALLRDQIVKGQAITARLGSATKIIEDLSGNTPWAPASARLSELVSRASESLDAFDELAGWSQWLTARAAACNDGLESLIAMFERREVPPQDLLPGFQLAYHSSVIRALFWELRDSMQSGLDQDEMRKQFRAADQEEMRLQRGRTAARIARRPVPAGRQTGPIKTWTDLALISNEISKQKRHIPIRQLVLRAGAALQALKPCFLMGPLSVAQYLPPGGLTFDLVVMDEASQLKPEDAIGAVARGGQMVVVGDPKQLPPTNFFQRVLRDEDDNDEERTVASEGESILDVASTLYQPIRRLRWHYRSRHESLIAYSNREFYDGKLLICPSAYDSHPQLGVRYRSVGGVYEHRKNPIEARAVAEAVVEHVKSGSGDSLGVVALNFEQAELLEEVIERRLDEEPEARACLELMEERGEPFFVKNLENVQGDERDIIFISCTYGPDPQGNQYQRFGPVNSADGHRRLNVLFTRAKRRCEAFSSLNPDKIHDDGKQRGVRVFKQYLKYAQSGRLDNLIDTDGLGPESDFEESVGNLLRQEGHEITTQIGVSGFRIDIGVRNPAKPGAYVLGVECDGRAYHSGRSARDRDRLRQEILENQGWKIHRIWSTDWFHSRQREVDRLIARVKQALESDPDYRDWRVRELRRESVRSLLVELQEKISLEHPETPPDRRLLRDEMFDLFVTKRPTTQEDWFRVPRPLREQTEPLEIRLYLSRILAIFREASE